MCENKNNKWMCVAIVAAVVAALTTVAVFLRAYNDSFDCDLGDCCCDDCGCADEDSDASPNE